MADQCQNEPLDGTLPPPGSFQRMISWQLSQIPEYNQVDKTRRKKKSKTRSMSSSTTDSDIVDARAEMKMEGRDEQNRAVLGLVQPAEKYVVINSDGEEEVYFSAVESPFTSSDDQECSLLSIPSDKGSPEIEFPMSSPSRSKKRKKKRRQTKKIARDEFFQPFCDLLDESVSLDIGDVHLQNFSAIPSLSDLCLRHLRDVRVPQNDLPYLISSLVIGEQQLSNIDTVQRQWLQKQLNDVEIFGLQKEDMKEKKECTDKKELYIYDVACGWDVNFQPICVSDIDENAFPHIPLALPNSRNYLGQNLKNSHVLFPLILNYMNYYLPLALDDRAGSNSIAIGRATYFFQSRYPKLSNHYSNNLKLWGAYVHWARGNLAVATDLFTYEIESLKDFDQAISINEMARMFIWFGDRDLAMFYYRKSSEVDVVVQNPPVKYDTGLLKICYFALQASVWDTGTMDALSSANAQSLWQVVLKECTSIHYNNNIWYLPVSAVESKLRSHAGQLTETLVKNKGMKTDMQWLEECEKIITDINLRSFPILQYHLSLVYAMKGARELSLRAFTAYINDFAGFAEWPEGVPGQFHASQIGHQRPHPWQNLFMLMERSKLSCVPILKVCWRVRLLHPLFVYGRNEKYSTIADSTPFNNRLEFRIIDGYLTGDMQMNIPPLKTVLLDPYDGHICFSRKASLQHYYLNMLSSETNHDACSSTLPWPLRLYETSTFTVELELCNKLDIEFQQYETNYKAILHYYGSDGSHFKVDLRKLIRKEQKNAVLTNAKDCTDLKTPPDLSLDEYIAKMADYGFKYSVEELYHIRKMPTVYSEKEKGNSRKRRYSQFMLHLKSHILFGKGTILLQFSLHCSRDDGPNALVFINCTRPENFLSPTIYCTGSRSGFSSVWPDTQTALLYDSRHLCHVKYVTALKSELVQQYRYKQSFHTFDEDGNTVHITEDLPNAARRQAVPLSDCTLSKKLYRIDSENNCLKSYTATECRIFFERESLPINEIQNVTVVPGAVLVKSILGLSILNPGTLEKMEIIDGIEDLIVEQDGLHVSPQFIAQSAQIDILKVFNVESVVPDDTDQQLNENLSTCCFAVSIKDRLLILKSSRKNTCTVLLDVRVPGKAIEIHPIINRNGYIVIASQFSDKFRSDLYWLSSGGLLKGMLPCLGYGDHCVFSAHLSKKESEANQYESGTYIYFYDGEGAICCLRL